MQQIEAVRKLNLREAELGIDVGHGSWHDQYSKSAYVYVGGLSYDLSEGDVLTIFSQVGEIIDCNLVRDKETGDSKGFAFIGYEDQRSTVLAVDNFNGAKILDRLIRVDHVEEYKIPRKKKKRGPDGRPVSSSEEETDSEAELYLDTGDNLNPLQKRMIKAKVQRELSSDDSNESLKSEDAPKYKHSFYAEKESEKDREKRLKSEKKRKKRDKERKKQDEKREKKRRKKESKREKEREKANPFDQNHSALEGAPLKTGTVKNPFLQQHLKGIQSSSSSAVKDSSSSNKCYNCGEEGHFSRDCPHEKKYRR